MSEKSGGTATTGRIKKPRTGDGRGRGKGNERGSQVNEKTLITGTKRSTGIAEITTQTWCGPKMTLYSSAWDVHLLPPSQSSFTELTPTSPTVCPPRPLPAGVLLLPVRFEYVNAQVGSVTFGRDETSKSFSFLTCSLHAFTSATEMMQETLLRLLFLGLNQVEKHLQPCGDRGTKTTCLLSCLFKEAPSKSSSHLGF